VTIFLFSLFSRHDTLAGMDTFSGPDRPKFFSPILLFPARAGANPCLLPTGRALGTASESGPKPGAISSLTSLPKEALIKWNLQKCLLAIMRFAVLDSKFRTY
jgi:hypothetical protein